jgi:hypothetical protein
MILSRRLSWQPDVLAPYLWAVVVGLIMGVASFVSPFIAAGLILAVVIVMAALHKPVLLLFFYTLAVVLLSGIPRGSLIPIFVPNEPLLAGVIGLGGLIILLVNAGRKSTERISPVILLAIAVYFVGTALLPTLIYLMRGWRLGIAQIFNLIAPIQYLLLLWICANLPRNEDERMELIHVMIWCSSLVAISGLLQAANFGPMMQILERFYPSTHLTTAAESGRVTSILNAWNSLGNFLMINIVVIVSIAGKKRGFLYTANIASALALNVACLIASGSFASIGGLLVALALAKYFDRRGLKLLVILGTVAIVATILLLPLISLRFQYQFGGPGNSGTPQTLAYRFYLWETIFFPALGKDNNFVWGISPLLNTGIFTWAWTENHYLFLLVRSGLISLVAHLAWVGMTLWWLRRLMKAGRDDLQRTLAVVMFALLVALTIMGLTNEVFTNSGSMDYFWMLIGLTAKGGDLTKSFVKPPQPVGLVLPARES